MKIILGCLSLVLLCGCSESVMGPKYSRGEQEMPLGEESRGSYTIRVYTKEQQERLNVDKIGGVDPGAPKNPKIGKKFLITTLITTIIFLVIYYLVKFDLLNLREFLQ